MRKAHNSAFTSAPVEEEKDTVKGVEEISRASAAGQAG
jgi:hypothetical protein